MAQQNAAAIPVPDLGRPKTEDPVSLRADFGFRHLDLFRISIFGFRICGSTARGAVAFLFHLGRLS
jgi:hypothetical protein